MGNYAPRSDVENIKQQLATMYAKKREIPDAIPGPPGPQGIPGPVGPQGPAGPATDYSKTFDFVLGSADQQSRGDSKGSRALVKEADATLVMNWGNDFKRVQINGPVNISGDLTQNGKPISAGIDVNNGLAIPSGQALTIRDNLHGMVYDGQVDGPKLYGYSGGALATTDPQKTGNSLVWNSEGVVLKSQMKLWGARDLPTDIKGPTVYHKNNVGLGLHSDWEMSFDVNGNSGAPVRGMYINKDGDVSTPGKFISRYTHIPYTDSSGNDIRNLQNVTWNQCAENCNGDVNCKGFNFNSTAWPNGNGTCWIKNNIVNKNNTGEYHLFSKNF